MKNFENRLKLAEKKLKENGELYSTVTFKDGTVKRLPILDLYREAISGTITEVCYPSADKEKYGFEEVMSRSFGESVNYHAENE